MRILLDTHVLIWHVEDDPQLSNDYSDQIEDAANQVFVSIASLWEIAIKMSIGKLKLSLAFSDLTSRLDASTIIILPIETRHLDIVVTLPFHHKDPFDRLLIAQSLSEGITLISADPHFGSYGVPLL
jgi:PIN domain nuclease of toxin-antitoxin system